MREWFNLENWRIQNKISPTSKRYLPTSFDDSLTIIQRINKIIHWLNDYSDLTEEMLAKWNEVYRWVSNEGLDEAVISRLNDWLKDGTLSNLINQNIYEDVLTLMSRVEEELELIDGKFSDLSDELKNEVKQLKLEIENDISLFQLKLDKHTNEKSIHRKIDYSDGKISSLTENINMFPINNRVGGSVLLGDYSPHGRVGSGFLMRIDPRIRDYIVQLDLHLIGNLKNTSVGRIVVRPNDDSDNNYVYFSEYKNQGREYYNTDSANLGETNNPRWGYLGTNPSYLHAKIVKFGKEDVTHLGWESSGFIHTNPNDTSTPDCNFNAGGIWFPQTNRQLHSLRVKTANVNNEWGNVRVILTGVLSNGYI